MIDHRSKCLDIASWTGELSAEVFRDQRSETVYLRNHGNRQHQLEEAMQRIVKVLYLTVLVLMLLGVGPWAVAQVDEGTVTGTVKDSTGAVIPGAEVTLTNVGTNFELKTKSNESGFYVFPPAKIGNYSIKASARGFKTATESGIVLQIAQRLNVDLVLTIGTVSENVEVQASAAQLLQTEEASTGQVIETQVIEDTPLGNLCTSLQPASYLNKL
jgi:hypothetical protein